MFRPRLHLLRHLLLTVVHLLKFGSLFFSPPLSSPPTRVQQYVTLILCNIVVVNFTRLNKANCCCFSFYSVQTYFRRFISEFSKGGAFGDALSKHHIF